MKAITYDTALWQLVPKEPTPEMISAPSTIIQAYAAKLIYQRMLDFAPSAPEQPHLSDIEQMQHAKVDEPEDPTTAKIDELSRQYGRVAWLTGGQDLHAFARALLASQPADHRLGEVLADMMKIQLACNLHTDEYAPGSVIEYIGELEASQPAAPVRTALWPMQDDDGKVEWYFDCNSCYIDVQKDANGKYSVLFKDRTTGEEVWHNQADAAPITMQDDAVRDAAWLVESTASPIWWDGRFVSRGIDPRHFTDDPNLAIRFARKVDAERVAQGSSGLKATDHVWIDRTQPSAAPVSRHWNEYSELEKAAVEVGEFVKRWKAQLPATDVISALHAPYQSPATLRTDNLLLLVNAAKTGAAPVGKPCADCGGRGSWIAENDQDDSCSTCNGTGRAAPVEADDDPCGAFDPPKAALKREDWDVATRKPKVAPVEAAAAGQDGAVAEWVNEEQGFQYLQIARLPDGTQLYARPPVLALTDSEIKTMRQAIDIIAATGADHIADGVRTILKAAEGAKA